MSKNSSEWRCQIGRAPLLVSPNPVPSQMRDNPQQVLRWGWSPNSPQGVTATDYEKCPTFWVNKKIKHGARKSTVASFDDGSYSVNCNGTTQDFTHENLMSWIGAARSSRHSGSWTFTFLFLADIYDFCFEILMILVVCISPKHNLKLCEVILKHYYGYARSIQTTNIMSIPPLPTHIIFGFAHYFR